MLPNELLSQSLLQVTGIRENFEVGTKMALGLFFCVTSHCQARRFAS